MSLKRGAGRGCDASHETLAAEIGCNYINLGKSIKKLAALGYLECSRSPKDRREHVYRVPGHLYDHKESLSFHQPSAAARKRVSAKEVGLTANEAADLVCHDGEENVVDSEASPPQYISQSDETYPVETGKGYSSQEARLSARSASKIGFAVNDGAQLAKFERDWKARPSRFKLPHLEAWLAFCEQAQEVFGRGDPEFGQAQRLASEIEWAIDELRSAPGQAA